MDIVAEMQFASWRYA